MYWFKKRRSENVDSEEKETALKPEKKKKENKEKKVKKEKKKKVKKDKGKLFKSEKKEKPKKEKKDKKVKAKKKKKKKSKPSFFARLNDRAANLIFFHDRTQDFIIKIVNKFVFNVVKLHHGLVHKLAKHRSEILVTSIGFFFVMFAMFSVFNHNTVYSYSYNGKELGYVEKEEDVIKILDLAGEALSEQTNADIQIVPYENITFSAVSAANKDVDDIDTVLKRLTYMTDLEVKAYGIYADDKLLAIVEDQDKALKTLSLVKEYYMPEDENVTYISAEFKENIEFREIDTVLANVSTVSAASEKLIKEEEAVINHTVKPDETYEQIAETYGITVDRLLSQNSGVDEETAQEGDTLFIVVEEPNLTLVTVEERTSMQEIEYETEEKETTALYKGEELVSQKGVVGRGITESVITRENGEKTEEDIRSQDVLEEPVTEIILIGTKEAPARQGTGTYIMPVRGAVLTAGFGMRWGTMHTGIDLAAATGTPIHAADGGTVTFSGWKGAYGYCIIIDHGANNSTLYGHCSALYVSVGDKVFKDQVIAAMGSTGRSTGPHLHFEVRINDQCVDPMDYL